MEEKELSIYDVYCYSCKEIFPIDDLITDKNGVDHCPLCGGDHLSD